MTDHAIDTLGLADRVAKLRRSHRECDDCWYSCPKSERGCCNESQGDDCNCGADEHNAEVEAIVTALRTIRAASDFDIDAITFERDQLFTALRQIVEAFDKGGIEFNSHDMGDPDCGIPIHPWHEEWLHYARQALEVGASGGALKSPVNGREAFLREVLEAVDSEVLLTGHLKELVDEALATETSG